MLAKNESSFREQLSKADEKIKRLQDTIRLMESDKMDLQNYKDNEIRILKEELDELKIKKENQSIPSSLDVSRASTSTTSNSNIFGERLSSRLPSTNLTKKSSLIPAKPIVSLNSIKPKISSSSLSVNALASSKLVTDFPKKLSAPNLEPIKPSTTQSPLSKKSQISTITHLTPRPSLLNKPLLTKPQTQKSQILKKPEVP